jgi:hypothetical protein
MLGELVFVEWDDGAVPLPYDVEIEVDHGHLVVEPDRHRRHVDVDLGSPAVLGAEGGRPPGVPGEQDHLWVVEEDRGPLAAPPGRLRRRAEPGAELILTQPDQLSVPVEGSVELPIGHTNFPRLGHPQSITSGPSAKRS